MFAVSSPSYNQFDNSRAQLRMSEASAYTDQSESAISRDKFVTIKICNKLYTGRQSTLVFINNVTRKMRDKIKRVRLMEQKRNLQQAESYRATMNHEIRTPLESSLHVLFNILNYLHQKDSIPIEIQEQVESWLRLSISSITFVQTFI